jgi:hypothetical protein
MAANTHTHARTHPPAATHKWQRQRSDFAATFASRCGLRAQSETFLPSFFALYNHALRSSGATAPTRTACAVRRQPARVRGWDAVRSVRCGRRMQQRHLQMTLRMTERSSTRLSRSGIARVLAAESGRAVCNCVRIKQCGFGCSAALEMHASICCAKSRNSRRRYGRTYPTDRPAAWSGLAWPGLAAVFGAHRRAAGGCGRAAARSLRACSCCCRCCQRCGQSLRMAHGRHGPILCCLVLKALRHSLIGACPRAPAKPDLS